MMLVSGSVAGFWVCPSSRTSPASAARHLLTLPTPLSRVGSSSSTACTRTSSSACVSSSSGRRLRGGPGVPGQQFGKCHVFPQKAKTWRAGLRLVRTQGTPPPAPNTPSPPRARLLGLERLGGGRSRSPQQEEEALLPCHGPCWVCGWQT